MADETRDDTRRLAQLNGLYREDNPQVQALLLSQDIPRRVPGFTTWLFRQRDRDHRVGDLARDAALDPDWPRQATAFRTFYAYLRRREVSESMITSLAIAWCEYAINEYDELARAVAPKAIIPPDLRWRVWERDDFTCRRCGTRRHLAVDHIIPESKGGTLEIDNLQTLCRPCNSSKGARDEWA